MPNNLDAPTSADAHASENGASNPATTNNFTPIGQDCDINYMVDKYLLDVSIRLNGLGIIANNGLNLVSGF